MEYGGGMGGGYMPSTQGGGFGSPSVGQSPGMDGRKVNFAVIFLLIY